MKSLSHLFISILILSLWACSGTKSESKQEMADSEAPKSEEPAAAPTDAAMSGELYSIKVLNDKKSPMKELSAKLGGTDLKLIYSSPSINGRELYGGLVPYGEVWRTGANEATTFEVSTDVEVGGKALPAGKYGLFTIPGEKEWTLIFNSVSEQWGAYDYDDSKDVLRVSATPKASDKMSETMEFMRSDDNTLVYHWGNVMVPFTVAAK